MPPQEKRSRTLIKVCGVRTPEEAVAILALGADAVGVVLAEGSPRQVDAATAMATAAAVGPNAVLVDRNPQDPLRLAFIRAWRGAVQVHGAIPPLGRRCVAAIAGDAPPTRHGNEVTAWLLDSPEAGSGAPWKWSRPAWTDHRPLILAGGLRAENVEAAIGAAHPWAVDVSSGVERARGVKDLALVREFIHAVRRADVKAGRSEPAAPAGFAELA